MVDQDDIPIPKADRVTLDTLVAFQRLLHDLFNTYPPAEPPGYSDGLLPVRHCRQLAIEAMARHNPKQAAHMACDTGAPNDQILAAYTLLFR